MKVLSVNNVFAWGSTGKIVKDIHEQLLREGVESVVCFARQRGKVNNPPFVYKFCTELEGDIWHGLSRYFGFMPYGGMWFSTCRLISIIKKERPDIVHLHCINDYSVNIYRLFRFLGENRIPTVITNHAEFYYTGSCPHSFSCDKFMDETGCGPCPNLRWSTGSRTIDRTLKAWKKMKDAVSHFNKDRVVFAAVSPWVKDRFMLSPITNAYCCEVVENGLDVNVFCPREVSLDIVQKVDARDRKIVLYSSASFNDDPQQIKGGYYVIELARRMPNVRFVVAAIEVSCDAQLPPNLLLWGATQSQDELAMLYSMADVTLLTSKRETFSMVTAESLCCGTPVVGFKAGGPESIALLDYSHFVEYGDVDALQTKLGKVLSQSNNKERLVRTAVEKFDKRRMADKYLSLYGRFE